MRYFFFVVRTHAPRARDVLARSYVTVRRQVEYAEVYSRFARRNAEPKLCIVYSRLRSSFDSLVFHLARSDLVRFARC